MSPGWDWNFRKEANENDASQKRNRTESGPWPNQYITQCWVSVLTPNRSAHTDSNSPRDRPTMPSRMALSSHNYAKPKPQQQRVNQFRYHSKRSLDHRLGEMLKQKHSRPPQIATVKIANRVGHTWKLDTIARGRSCVQPTLKTIHVTNNLESRRTREETHDDGLTLTYNTQTEDS